MKREFNINYDNLDFYSYERFTQNLSNLQLFFDHIYELIDEADYIVYSEIIPEYAYEIPKEYSEIYFKYKNKLEKIDTNYIFDIREKRQYLKDNLRFALTTREEAQPIQQKLDYDFLLNHEDIEFDFFMYSGINFIKDDNVIFAFDLNDGCILDYRKKVKKHIKKFNEGNCVRTGYTDELFNKAIKEADKVIFSPNYLVPDEITKFKYDFYDDIAFNDIEQGYFYVYYLEDKDKFMKYYNGESIYLIKDNTIIYCRYRDSIFVYDK